jgi:Ca-activated chloride channel family protein
VRLNGAPRNLPHRLFRITLPLATLLTLGLATSHAPAYAQPQKEKAQKLPKPRQLDKDVTWKRDPATGELRLAVTPSSLGAGLADAPVAPPAIQVRTQMVPITCTVSAADGSPVLGLTRQDFQVFKDGIAQTISYFDASTQPASVALVIDASPSVLRDADEMRRSAEELIGALAPLDQAAVVDFSQHTYLQLPFSDVRELIRQAVLRVDARTLLQDTGGSNIYQSVYLAARDLFPGRSGRKAIVLLTDGQDSGLGLTLDPASAVPGLAPSLGSPGNRLTFDDIARLLAAEDIQVFAVSTENRPKIMTAEWLAAHQNATLISPDARQLGIPAYTLYLAELVRRAGGQLYFLREAETMADTFRKIAERIRAEYTIGFYPAPDPTPAATGWRPLRVTVVDQPGARVAHRAAYYAAVAP